MLEPIDMNWLPCIGVGIIMGGGEIIPVICCGLIIPGMGWKPMAEFVIGVKSDCFLGEAAPWLGLGLPPPLMRETR